MEVQGVVCDRTGLGRHPLRVSVLLPVYNSAATLQAALSSVLLQEGITFEVVVVDDGSDDGSRAVLAETAAHDERVRRLYLEHRGLVPALQAGLSACRGAYIARMDADDVMLPKRLVTQAEFLDRHRSVVAVGGAARYVVEGRPSPGVIRPPLGGDELRELLEHAPPLVHPTAVMRREAVERVGGYRSAFRHAEDYDLWLRLAETGELANVPDLVLDYRISADQVTVRHLEASCLANLGARTCAGFRREGLPDPAPTEGVIDRQWLFEHGWDPVTVDRLLLDSYVDRIWWLAELGLTEPADRLVADLGRLDVAPSLVRTHRFRWRWEGARIAWLSNRRCRAVGRLVMAFASSPISSVKRICGAIGRRLGGGSHEPRR